MAAGVNVAGLVALLVGLAGLLVERGIRAGARAGRRDVVLGRSERPAGGSGRRISITTATVAILALSVGLRRPALGLMFGIGWVVAGRLRAGSRRRAARALADEQLADATGSLAAAIRAGMSVPQALGYVAAESEEPAREPLAALVSDVEMGVPLSTALATWSGAVGSSDAQLVASALELHRRAGGDLPSVLDQVGATIRERVAVVREVRALTAQARLSGLILGLLPIGFFAFLWLTSRADMQAALGTPAGVASMALGLTLELAAFLWIRRLLVVSA